MAELASTLSAQLARTADRPVRVVLDTDTYNEIDDQFALVYALLSPEQLSLEAVYAAPFHNSRSSGPGDGMRKSYEEIERVLRKLDRGIDGFAFAGSDHWLPDRATTVDSPAVADLVARARSNRDGPLYVAAIGAITNVAAALIAAPDIRDKIVVLWLGGHPLHWRDANEFNMQGDPTASRVVLDSGVPLLLFPCMLVAEALTTSRAELAAYVRDRSEIGTYLYRIFTDYERIDLRQPGSSKVIWDLAPIAWLVKPDSVQLELVHSPILTETLTWNHDAERHLIAEARHIRRDVVFADFFAKLSASSAPTE